jgi:hypothetical protein
MISGVLRILLYLALGPLVGMLAGNLAIGVSTFIATGSTHDFVFDATIVAPQNLIASYTIGLAPALITGVLALLLARSFRGWRLWLLVAWGGASVSLAIGWVMFGSISGIEPIRFSAFIAFAGAAAAFVCAMLFDLVAGSIRRTA